MIKRVRRSNVKDGVLLPLGNGFSLVKGDHPNKVDDVDIGPNNKNGLSVNHGEILQQQGNTLRVFSAEPMLGGVSPVQLLYGGMAPDKVFAMQEQYKRANRIADDGSKYRDGGKKTNPHKEIDWSDIVTTNNRPYNKDYIDYINKSLINFGYNNNQRASILANIIEESGGDPFIEGPGGYYGLLQWGSDRYTKTDEKDAYREIDNQLKYLNNTIGNIKDKKSWTHGGKGSGYNSFSDAIDAYNSDDLNKVMHGFTWGYVRPAGKQNSYLNRQKVADQLIKKEGFQLGGQTNVNSLEKKSNTKFGDWFRNATLKAAMADAPAVMQASGWDYDKNGNLQQGDPNAEGPTKLRNNLAEIAMMPATDMLSGLVGSAIVGSKFYKNLSSLLKSRLQLKALEKAELTALKNGNTIINADDIDIANLSYFKEPSKQYKSITRHGRRVKAIPIKRNIYDGIEKVTTDNVEDAINVMNDYIQESQSSVLGFKSNADIIQQIAKDSKRLRPKHKISLTDDFALSKDSYPLYQQVLLRNQANNVGHINVVKDNGVIRMMRLNHYGTNPKSFSRIDKGINQLKTVLNDDSIPDRVTLFGNTFVPAIEFYKYKYGGLINPLGERPNAKYRKEMKNKRNKAAYGLNQPFYPTYIDGPLVGLRIPQNTLNVPAFPTNFTPKSTIGQIDPFMGVKPSSTILKNAPISNGVTSTSKSSGLSALGADLIGSGINAVGSLIAAGINQSAINNQKFTPRRAVLLNPVKLKTKININPQLAKLRETQAQIADAARRTSGSSREAYRRILAGHNRTLESAMDLYGRKENMETELINRDKINQQGIASQNATNVINTLNTNIAGKDALNNNWHMLTAQNWINPVNVIAGTVAGERGILARRDARRNNAANLAMMSLAYPDAARMIMNGDGWQKAFNGYYNMLNNKVGV